MFKKLLLSVTAASLSFSALAAELSNEVKLALTEKVQGLGLEVMSVEPSQIEGLVQVATPRGIFYLSEDGQYFMQGQIFNMNEEMRNETAAAMRVLEEPLRKKRAEKLKTVADSSIEFKAKDEKYVVNVFTDISCGYCRKLHNEMQAYNDAGITVRYLAFPRGGLKSKAFSDMVSVWCSEDQQDAMTEAKARGTIAKAQSCQQPVLQHYDLGVEFGVTGTPAIVLDDGSIIPGYQPAAQLLKRLNAS
ncbi:bifunctional protein-disulfide isomerase/oxidoreductase DsbC [Catenovulum sp. SM1970]|uniref:bifunctional protein-disulfide isomerase/oxidoreductase DsbC n=1 Tax=Marinifaba aquimaris TaxID=2741323 RepID=UPI001572AC25|nr:bifunctional protein-disulfide isomerase/oxidoreductase DsbC [Marinifaba aquimaris]NTS75447.1 bifunctional protein-disulfide isomerase/oxidoreductase DsbC [Marinifaba aquimaris]